MILLSQEEGMTPFARPYMDADEGKAEGAFRQRLRKYS